MIENATDVAYRILKDEAVEFRLPPGAPINEATVATRLGVGRGPVREAMNRLMVEGLVTFVPRRGFFCRRLSVREVRELMEVRADLEAAAVAAVAADGDRRAVETVRDDWRQGLAATGEDDLTALMRLDERFHGDLAALAGNGVRADLLARLRDRAAFIRRTTLENRERRRASFAEHETLLSAILDGDAEGARRVVRDHLALSPVEALTVVEHGMTRLSEKDVA